jgi:CubicO group peptidase (beta-lactamase class C family)
VFNLQHSIKVFFRGIILFLLIINWNTISWFSITKKKVRRPLYGIKYYPARSSCSVLGRGGINMRVIEKGLPEEVGVDNKGLGRANDHLCKAIKSGEIGAASLTVVRRGKVIFERGYGLIYPAVGSSVVNVDSVFLLASITKPVTVWSLMQLVDEGEISIDDPVSHYLPEFSGGMRNRVLVRHLLSHTSGLPDMLPKNVELRRSHATLDEFVQGTIQTPLQFEPNTDFSYQSKGTLLASAIVERVSGESLRDFQQRRIFSPLNMRSSSLGLGGRSVKDLVWCGTASADRESEDERSWGWNTKYWRDLGAPWGGMHSNGKDLAVLLQTAMNGGIYDGHRILSFASAQAMQRNQNTHLAAPWGLGWAMADSIVWNRCGELVSSNTFGHTGATGTVAWADPLRELICIVLTNKMSHEGSLLRRVSNAVSAAVVDP